MPEGSIRDRLATLSRGELLGLAAILVVTLGGAGLWYARSLPRPVEVRAASASARPAATASASAAPTLIVDVSGAVRRPGVYEFREGDRVIDAIRAAGGASGKAALDALNLAAPLTDGIQILVPQEMPPAAPGTSSAPGTTTTTLVNLNSSTAAELETLPGIGEVIAQRIIDYRTQNGPFTTVDDLLEVSGIGDAILGDVRDLVTV